MASFFKSGDFPCAIYCRTRDKTDKHNSRGRDFMEAMWLECAAWLDPDTLQRATLDMPPVFWELYLAHTLRGAGIRLHAQTRTKSNKRGPDLFATNPDVWIEAVMAQMGTGPDAMQYPPMGVAYDVPVKPFVLRLRNAIETKAAVMATYIRDGLIRPDQATVIGISSAVLPTAIGEGPIPRILQAVLGVGNPVVNIARQTGQIVSYQVEHRDEVAKRSGTMIKTDPFLDQSYSHISAIIYSASCWVNHPTPPGSDFTVIHNENANVRLPHGWLPIGDEYWRHDDQLHSARHSPWKGAGPDVQLKESN
jgi:hypothetical protein